MTNSFNAKTILDVSGKEYIYYSLPAAAKQLGDVTRLPFSLKVLLEKDRKSTRLNSSHSQQSRMPSSA